MKFLKSLADIHTTLNPFPKKLWILRVFSTSLLKTMWEKKKSLVKSNFCFSHIVFSPIGELSAIFNKFEICHLQLWEFGSLKFVVWERVKSIIQQLMRGHVVFANHYWFHSKFNAINVEKKQNFWLATPFGLTNQKLCYFQIWKKKMFNPLPHNTAFWCTKDI